MRDATETKRRRNGSARLQSCRQSRNPTHSVIPNEVWDLLFPSARLLRDVLCGIARLSGMYSAASRAFRAIYSAASRAFCAMYSAASRAFRAMYSAASRAFCAMYSAASRAFCAMNPLFLRLERALTRLPARALVGARHAVPLFHFRLSTVDCRPLHRRPRYRVAGFSGLNTPCGLSFQIHAWTSQGDLAMKWPPFSVHWDSVRPWGLSRPGNMQMLSC
jgi:hypothetical protein